MPRTSVNDGKLSDRKAERGKAYVLSGSTESACKKIIYINFGGSIYILYIRVRFSYLQVGLQLKVSGGKTTQTEAVPLLFYLSFIWSCLNFVVY